MHKITNDCRLSFDMQTRHRRMCVEATNHFELLRRLMEVFDGALLVSPFLYDDFSLFFGGLELTGKRIELITTCAPKGRDQLRKPYALTSFAEVSRKATGNWPLMGLDQKLHSKIYIFYQDSEPAVGVITSANLTHSGLNVNTETGLVITETVLLEEVAASARAGLTYVHISEEQVEWLRKTAAATESAYRTDKPEDINIGIDNILEKYFVPSAGNRDIKLRDEAEYYIKVSGVRDRPILPEDEEPWDSPQSELSFAKAPSTITLGDCLLEIAVGGMCFLSHYACASAVFERTATEKAEHADYRRWPYYVRANNLSLHYGACWFRRPLYYDDVVRDFKERFPDRPVTIAGRDHFKGAMQLGHSYIHVTREFGEFVRKAIDAHRCESGETDQ